MTTSITAPNGTADGKTPLHRAAESGDVATVKQLLATGKVIPDFKDRNGNTPLHLAAKNGNGEIVRLLLTEGNANPAASGDSGTTALHRAASNGHVDIVQILLDTGADIAVSLCPFCSAKSAAVSPLSFRTPA